MSIWKKRKVQLEQHQQLGHQDEESDPESEEPRAKKSQLQPLEDKRTLYRRLRREGVELAQDHKYWQALHKWNEALDLNVDEERDDGKNVLEMRAQALMQVHEWEPAIQEAQKALLSDPRFYPARQTLGRAFLGAGLVAEARREFKVAFHLRPDDEELRLEDLNWAHQLYLQQKSRVISNAEQVEVKVSSDRK